MPLTDDFERELNRLLQQATTLGFQAVEISAGSLHKALGGYPGKDHRMPCCCEAMRKVSVFGDVELPNQLKRNGASFAVRYKLPRQAN